MSPNSVSSGWPSCTSVRTSSRRADSISAPVTRLWSSKIVSVSLRLLVTPVSRDRDDSATVRETLPSVNSVRKLLDVARGLADPGAPFERPARGECGGSTGR